MVVKIVSRTEWGAQPPKSTEALETPVATVVMYSETDTLVCYTKKECIKRMQELQKEHMEKKGHPDIKFNFLIGLDGRVYEGTGWNVRGTRIKHHADLNGKAISIAYIGNFEDWSPPYLMTYTAEKFIKYGIEQKYIDSNYRRGNIVWGSGDLKYDDDW